MNSNTNASANASGAIDFRTLPDFIPSMCIPRVYPNISEGRIRKIFDELNIGVIERVDIVSKNTEKGEKFNVLIKETNGWWLVKNLHGDVEGWAPSSYLSVSKAKAFKNSVAINTSKFSPWMPL